MKICIYNLTTGLKFGGVEIFTRELAKILAERGEDVYLFTGRGPISLSYSSFKIKRYCYLPHHYIPDLGTRFRKLFARLSFGFFSFRDLCKERFDIIHIQKPYDLPVAILAKAISGARIILSSHGTDFYFGDRFFAKKVDGAFSCASFNAEEIKNRYGLKVRVIYNGCDIKAFSPREPDRELKERLKLEDTPVIFTVGRLVQWKRVDILLNALPLVKTQNFKVIICGDGDYKPKLIGLSKKLGVSDRIIWQGSISHEKLPQYLSLANVFVQPSISETFSIALCEAMAMGIPAVASCSGGTPEAIDDGVNGFLVKPGNIKKIAEYIDILFGDRELRLRMGKEARRKVERMFTWDKVTDKVLEGYSEVLGR